MKSVRALLLLPTCSNDTTKEARWKAALWLRKRWRAGDAGTDAGYTERPACPSCWYPPRCSPSFHVL